MMCWNSCVWNLLTTAQLMETMGRAELQQKI